MGKRGPTSQYTVRINVQITPEQFEKLQEQANDQATSRSAIARGFIASGLGEDSPTKWGPDIIIAIEDHADKTGMTANLAAIDLIIAGVKWYQNQMPGA